MTSSIMATKICHSVISALDILISALDYLIMYNQGGWTALHNAAQGGHVETVRLLLDRDAAINSTTNVSNIVCIED